MINDFFYLLKIVKDNKLYTFTSKNTNEPHGISFNIISDTGCADTVGSIRLYGVDYKIISDIVGIKTSQVQYLLTLQVGYQGNCSTIYDGWCVYNNSVIDDNTSIIFNLKGTDINNAYINIKASKGTTYLQLKQQFATKLGLKLKSDISSDNNILNNDYQFFGTSAIAELKRLFKTQDIFIQYGTIYFTPKIKSTDYLINKASVRSVLLQDKLLKNVSLSEGYCLYKMILPLMPNLKLHDFITLKQTDKLNMKWNGTYMIRYINHNGVFNKRTKIDGTTEIITMSQDLL